MARHRTTDQDIIAVTSRLNQAMDRLEAALNGLQRIAAGIAPEGDGAGEALEKGAQIS